MSPHPTFVPEVDIPAKQTPIRRSFVGAPGVFARMRVDKHLSAGTMTCPISPRGFLEPDDRLNVARSPEFQAAQSAAPRKTHMDTTTLLIIVLLILLLGGGWYGRGRWY